MRKLVHLLLALIAAILAGVPAGGRAEPVPVRQVFLVQNSGWMEPFYLDAKSPLKGFVTSLVAKANLLGVPVTIAAFNQDGQVPGRRSPDPLYEGPYDRSKVTDAVERLDLPRKASGAYADADFHGALSGTFARLMHGDQGVIWMITNNKDAPDNRPGVIENTHAFYQALRSSPYVTAIAAFPMRKVVTGPHFTEKGLIVYAIAYGARGGEALAAILRSGAPVRTLFPAPPVKLKPLTTDPVELRLHPASGATEAKVLRGRLIISGVPGGAAVEVKLAGTLRNTYYPQNIEGADLDARWRSPDRLLEGTTVRMSPQHLTHVPAGGEWGPVQMILQLPAVPREKGLAGLLEDRRTVSGDIELRLDALSFSLDRDFVDRVTAISGADVIKAQEAETALASSLPEVFLDYRRVSSASMRVPVEITVRFSPWPLILCIALVLAILALLAYLLVVSSRARAYRIRVGESELTIRIKPRERRMVADALGARAEVTGSMFGPPSVCQIEA